MGSTSTQTDYSRQFNAPAEAVMLPPDHQLPSGRSDWAAGVKETVRSYSELAGEALEFARVSALCAYHRARLNLSRAADSTKATVSRTQERASDIQREYPVRVLAVVAGAAFLAGIGARIWRSRSL